MAAVEQGQACQQGIPDRRLAGLNVQPAVPLVRPVLIEGGQARSHDRVAQRIALDVERHQTVDPRWLNAAPGAVGVLMFDDPLQALADGGLAAGREAELLIGVQRGVGGQEKRLPGEQAGFARQAGVGPLPTQRKEFVQTSLGRQAAGKAAGRQNRQRHQGRPRPGGKIIDVERKPAGKGDHLGRQAGRFVPRPLADQGQPVAGENADGVKPAVGQDPVPGFSEGWAVGRQTAGPQRGVALDGGVDIAVRRPVVDLPGAVRALGCEQGVDDVVFARMLVAQDMHGQQPLGLHAAVGLQHADPVAVLGLVLVQPGGGGLDAGVEPGQVKVVGGIGCGGWHRLARFPIGCSRAD